MKIVILVGDGMGDFPVDELNGLTPLQAAYTPTLQKIASSGDLRMVQTVPSNLPPGSDVANMALLGYDAKENYTGRAPIEAAGANIKMTSSNIAFRCNFVSIIDDIMCDYSAGHISSKESAELIKSLKMNLTNNEINFFNGVQYRHILMTNGLGENVKCYPPHEIIDKNINEFLPTGSDADKIIDLMKKSEKILECHPINLARIKEGKTPASHIWLWGQGRQMQLESYRNLYGLSGGIISAVDLLKGLANLAGLEAPDIDGATGFIDTNYKGKVESALEILQHNDFVFVHIEAPDECGHLGDAKLKTKAIELFDSEVCLPILNWLEEKNDPYLLILSMDHRTPVALKGHTSDPVPMAALHGPVLNFKNDKHFDENVNNGISQGMAYKWIQELLSNSLN